MSEKVGHWVKVISLHSLSNSHRRSKNDHARLSNKGRQAPSGSQPAFVLKRSYQNATNNRSSTKISYSTFSGSSSSYLRRSA